MALGVIFYWHPGGRIRSPERVVVVVIYSVQNRLVRAIISQSLASV